MFIANRAVYEELLSVYHCCEMHADPMDHMGELGRQVQTLQMLISGAAPAPIIFITLLVVF